MIPAPNCLIRRSLVRAQIEESILMGPAAMWAPCRWGGHSPAIRSLRISRNSGASLNPEPQPLV